MHCALTQPSAATVCCAAALGPWGAARGARSAAGRTAKLSSACLNPACALPHHLQSNTAGHVCQSPHSFSTWNTPPRHASPPERSVFRSIDRLLYWLQGPPRPTGSLDGEPPPADVSSGPRPLPPGARPMAVSAHPTQEDRQRYKRRLCAFWERVSPAKSIVASLCGNSLSEPRCIIVMMVPHRRALCRLKRRLWTFSIVTFAPFAHVPS